MTLQSVLCMYMSWVKPWEDFGLDPSFFPHCKLHDVFHLLSPMFIKYLRNKIKALFVHKVVEIVYSFLGLSVKTLLLCTTLLFLLCTHLDIVLGDH